jgi:hypothetical protein
MFSVPSVTLTPVIVRTRAAFGPTAAQMSRLEMSCAGVSTMFMPKMRLPTHGPETVVP